MESINTQKPKKKRDITNSNIVVRISYLKDFKGNKISKEDDLGIRYQENLEQAYNKYSARHNIKNTDNQNFFFLEKDGKYIELEKSKKINSLNLKSGDRILVRAEKFNCNDVKKYKKENDKNFQLYNPNTNKLKKVLAFIIPISSIILIAIIALLLYFFYFRKKKTNDFVEESLITKINYIPNTIYRYKSNKITKMNVETTNISESNTSQNITQYTDFMLIIKDKN